ncbi:MAG: AAA family ATPase [Deltaproteobacteria bacterium]|nr:AAA family ATPase [Deltaproteobacteria bacterium]
MAIHIPRKGDSPKPITTTLSSRIQLWYGEKKIGKTVTASRIPGGAFFLQFEEGHDHVAHFGESIDSWSKLLAVLDELGKVPRGELPFVAIVWDTVAEAFRMCQTSVLGRLNVDHESDSGFGKGYSLVENEFRRGVTQATKLGLANIFIAHVDSKTMQNGKKGKDAREWKKTIIDLPRPAQKVIPGLTDLNLYFTSRFDEKTETHERVIITQGSDVIEAGVRYPPDWGEMPRVIPMSYIALEKAWNACAPKATPERSPEDQRFIDVLAAYKAKFGSIAYDWVKATFDLKDTAVRASIVERLEQCVNAGAPFAPPVVAPPAVAPPAVAPPAVAPPVVAPPVVAPPVVASPVVAPPVAPAPTVIAAPEPVAPAAAQESPAPTAHPARSSEDERYARAIRAYSDKFGSTAYDAIRAAFDTRDPNVRSVLISRIEECVLKNELVVPINGHAEPKEVRSGTKFA